VARTTSGGAQLLKPRVPRWHLVFRIRVGGMKIWL
jgi:hypothetical protein